MKNAMQRLVFYPIFLIGYLQHKLLGKTNKYAYLSFRRLYGLTQGKLNTSFSQKISRQVGKYPLPSTTSGVLGEFSRDKIHDIVHQIRENGYFVFKEKLPMSVCESLLSFAKSNPARTVPSKKGYEYITYDPEHVEAPMYKFREQDLLKSQDVREIITDMNFFTIAQEYLDCKPIQDVVVMWWSAPYSSEASSEAAQLYHFDMDHLRFLKFFVYLTPVGEHNGPHCYIRGSHRHKPEALYADKRFSDTLVQQHYAEDDIKVIEGDVGTVMAVDTSGIHKGKVVSQGDRLLFQMEYTNSLFGQKKDFLPDDKHLFSEEQLQIMQDKSYTFQRYL